MTHRVTRIKDGNVEPNWPIKLLNYRKCLYALAIPHHRFPLRPVMLRTATIIVVITAIMVEVLKMGLLLWCLRAAVGMKM